MPSCVGLDVYHQGKPYLTHGIETPAVPTSLRIERRAGSFRFLYKVDDKWIEYAPPAGLPKVPILADKLEVGVFATNWTTAAHTANFRDYECKESRRDESGWVPLFNGKDLTGWVASTNEKGADAAKAWTAKDNQLTCTGSPNGWLRTAQPYVDYDLPLEFQFVNDLDLVVPRVGFALHADESSFNKPHFWAEVSGNGVTRLAGVNQVGNIEERGKKLDFGTWHRLEFRCRGDTIQMILDHKVVATRPRCNPSRGYFYLAAANHHVNYRNIEVKPLDRQETGFVPLFNGKTLDGWRHRRAIPRRVGG